MTAEQIFAALVVWTLLSGVLGYLVARAIPPLSDDQP